MELVSILVPCYNHEKYIIDCMQSIINQTYKNIELIVCDDCSRDNSFDTLLSMEDKLKARFENVILIKNTVNQGVCKNLNNMLKLSKGNYIKLIASDDMLLPDAIENLVTFADKSKADIVFSNMYLIDNNLHFPIKDYDNLETFYTEIPKSGANLVGDIYARNFIAAPAVIFPRSTFDKYGLFDEKGMTEDLEYWLRVSVSGKFDYLNTYTVLYRKNDNSLSRFKQTTEGIEKNKKYHEHLRQVHKQYDTYVSVEDMAEFYNDELGNAMYIQDRMLTKDIFNYMNDRKIPIYGKNKLKLFLFKVGLYSLVRKIMCN